MATQNSAPLFTTRRSMPPGRSERDLASGDSIVISSHTAPNGFALIMVVGNSAGASIPSPPLDWNEERHSRTVLQGTRVRHIARPPPSITCQQITSFARYSIIEHMIPLSTHPHIAESLKCTSTPATLNSRFLRNQTFPLSIRRNQYIIKYRNPHRPARVDRLPHIPRARSAHALVVESVLTSPTIPACDQRAAISMIIDQVLCQGTQSPHPGAVDVVFRPGLFEGEFAPYSDGESSDLIRQPVTMGCRIVLSTRRTQVMGCKKPSGPASYDHCFPIKGSRSRVIPPSMRRVLTSRLDGLDSVKSGLSRTTSSPIL